jgi:membrane associated rhomboid family serine protease
MIPLKDDAPRYSTPFINYFLIVLNVLVFLFELSLGRHAERAFIYQFGLIPAAVTSSAQYAHGAVGLLPFLTSMFMHAGWLHLIFNMWALWIFGDNVEDQLGHFLYLVFYLVAGLAANCVHILFNLGSDVPTVGASGAIAGVMGAYFLLFPSARVLTLIPAIFFFPVIYLPAWVVLGYWFIVQFLSGAATAIPGSTQASGIAVWAHVGGFLVGAALIKIMPHRMQRRERDLSWE